MPVLLQVELDELCRVVHDGSQLQQVLLGPMLTEQPEERPLVLAHELGYLGDLALAPAASAHGLQCPLAWFR